MVKRELDYVADAAFPDEMMGPMGLRIIECLRTKGFCVMEAGGTPNVLRKALGDIEELKQDDQFYFPAPELVDGFLGETGSARVAEMTTSYDDQAKPDGLALLDYNMAKVISPVTSCFSMLGFESVVRTKGLLHESGPPAEPPPKLDPLEAGKWLNLFSDHALMIIWFVGPSTGTLELKPVDEDANAHSLEATPGTMVILMADAMYRRFSSHGEAVCLSCFYMKLKEDRKGKMKREICTPWAQTLKTWVNAYLQAAVEAPHPPGPEMPAPFRRIVAQSIFRSQPVLVASTSWRQPGTWNADSCFQLAVGGTDFVTKVPVKRYDVDEYSLPDLDAHLQNKTYCIHGGFMEGADLFDNLFFRISRSETHAIDPGQRMILEVGYDACYRAGYKAKDLMNSRGAHIVSMPMPLEWGVIPKTAVATGCTGGGGSIACGRFSFQFGMKGPSTAIDLDAAGGHVAMQSACTLLTHAGMWAPNPFALCSSNHLHLSHFMNVHWATDRSLSMQGRCFTFDESADGFVRGECCVAIVFQCMIAMDQDGKRMIQEDEDGRGQIHACHSNQCGKRSSLTAPDSSGQQEVMIECMRMLHLHPLDVEAVETWGDGQLLHDAVEVAATARAYRTQGEAGQDFAQPLGLTATKTYFGNQIEAAGLTTMIKLMYSAKWGSMTPVGHIRAINPHVEFELSERGMNIVGETVEFAQFAMFQGTSGHNRTGTNCHILAFAETTKDLLPGAPAKQWTEHIRFWPAGGGQTCITSEGFFIAGSWSKWVPQRMESESDGIHAYTVTVGDLGFENFQIWVDGDRSKTLHPGRGNAAAKGRVRGPDTALKYDSWLLTGSAGSRFRIRLSVAGKWHSVDWEELEAVQPGPELQEASYQLVGNFGDSDVVEMLSDPSSPGTWSAEVQQTEDRVNFWIIRNSDWTQVICPASALHRSVSKGKSGEEPDYSWTIRGKIGSFFRITFNPSREGSHDVEWVNTHHRALDRNQQREHDREVFWLCGTLEKRKEQHMMRWTGQYYQLLVRRGKKPEYRFHVFSSKGYFVPNIEDATVYDSYLVRGPVTKDDVTKQWCIGKGENDNEGAGTIMEIRLTLEEDTPRVFWDELKTEVDVDKAHAQGYLTWCL